MNTAFLFVLALLGSSIVYAQEDGGSGEGSGVEPTRPTRPDTTTSVPSTTTETTTTALPLCEEFGNTCDENADCYEQDGSFGCICKDGYSGNGLFCEDVNECTADPCAEFAKCVNLEGSFTCTCRDGFYGNGYERCLNTERSLKFLQEVGKSFNPFARIFSFWIEVSDGLRRFNVELV